MTPATNHALGAQLRSARLALGLTQSDVAVKAGVSKAYVSKVETGKERPSDPVIYRLADALLVDGDLLVLLAGRVPEHYVSRMAAEPAWALWLLREHFPTTNTTPEERPCQT